MKIQACLIALAALKLCLAAAQNNGKFVPSIDDDKGEGPWEDETKFGGLSMHKPGLKVRLA